MRALFTLKREGVINLKTGKGRDEWVARPNRRRSWTEESLRAALDEIRARDLKAILMGSNTAEIARVVVPDAMKEHDGISSAAKRKNQHTVRSEDK
jgi:hypothetical protein